MKRLLPAILLALASCGGPPPPPPPPTVVQATVSAGAEVNETDGAGQPLAVRIYQLAGRTAFDGASFFNLFNKDAATLGADLVKRDDLIVAPGASKQLTLSPEDRVHAIGVFGAYRDFDHVAWRAVAAVPPHATSLLTVTAGKDGLAATLAPAKPQKQ